MFVKKDQGIECLALCGSRHAFKSHQTRQKRLHIFDPEILWMNLQFELSDIMENPLTNGHAVYDKFDAGSEEPLVVSVGAECGIPETGNVIDFFSALCFDTPMSAKSFHTNMG